MKTQFLACAVVATALTAGCGGGGSGIVAPTPVATATPTAGAATPTATPTAHATATPTPVVTATPTPAPTATPAAVIQVINASLPGNGIGTEVDPTFGDVSGYTQRDYSQVLGFVPGAMVMVRNNDTSAPHTFSTVGTTGFTANPTLSTTAAGGSTIGTGFSTGRINGGGTLSGPYTLASGTYYMGCAYHYSAFGMRTVLVVAAGATPGAQATPDPGGTPAPTPPPGYSD